MTIEHHHIHGNRARLRLEGGCRRLTFPGNTLSMEWESAAKKSEWNETRAQVHRTHLTAIPFHNKCDREEKLNAAFPSRKAALRGRRLDRNIVQTV
jgi:hypothetical protein